MNTGAGLPESADTTGQRSMRRLARGGVATIGLLLAFLTSIPSSSYAEHERFTVGAMRNVDPSDKIITSTSGACVPTHDRQRLDCYFTSFGLWKSKTDEELKKQVVD